MQVSELEKKYWELSNFVYDESLDRVYKKIVDIGEIPYQANISAIQKIDMKRDIKGGDEKLQEVISGINSFQKQIRLYQNAIKRIKNKTNSFIR